MLDKIILNVPKEIIAQSGSASWINVIYISVIAVLIVWFISFLFKKFEGKDLLDICEFLGGNTLKNIIGFVSIVFIMFILTFALTNFSETLKLIYFRTSPLIFIVLLLIIPSLIGNNFSIKVLAKANLIIVPVVLFSIIIILISSIKNFVPERIFPILGYGVNETFFSGLGNLFSFSGLYYLLFLNPFIYKTKKLKKISIISTAISGIYLFASVICLLFSLPFTFNNNELFSLYLLSRSLEYGRFFQRIDAIFIFIWILTTISYICISMYFCIYMFKKITRIHHTKTINYTFHLLILAVLLVPTNIAIINNGILQFIKTTSLILIYIVSLLILILANFKIRYISKKKGKV